MAHTSPLMLLHERAGAAAGTFFDCALPARFSSLDRELAFAVRTIALFDTNYQCYAWLSGPDRVRYLNAVTTNDIKSLVPGQGVTGLLLNPQGHILAEITTYELAERLLLRSHAAVRERTLQTLEKFIIMDDATLTDAASQLGSLAMEGPLALQLAQDLTGVQVKDAPQNAHWESAVEGIPCRIVRRSHFGQPGVEFIAEIEPLKALWDLLATKARALQGGRIGCDALNTLRLEAGIPWFTYDFDDKVIPHEAGLEHSHISYSKGCYTGQEIVERVRARGQVNRRLTTLKFDAPHVPEAGTKLLALEKEAGQVTSAAFSPRLQCPVGFAYIRREHAATGSELTFPGGTAQVISLSTPS